MANGTDDFSAEMVKTGVSPLTRRQGKVLLRQQRQNPNIIALRKSAADIQLQASDPLHYSGVEWLGPYDVVEYKSQGMQHESFKNLKRGRYDIGATLDLHGYYIEEARTLLFQFVEDCIKQDIRCVIIVHGKGWHAGSGEQDDIPGDISKKSSRLKSYVVHWLKKMSIVQALCSTQAKDGGTGSLYVLFRKASRGAV